MNSELLPHELHSHILEQGLDPSPFGRRTFTGARNHVTDFVSERNRYLPAISLVSRSWKEVSYSTPALWSLINVDCRKEQPNLIQAVTYLLRAGHLPLDICVLGTTPSRDHPKEVWQFWTLLKKLGPRWRSLFIVGSPDHHLSNADYLPRRLPQLEACEVFTDRPPGMHDISVAPNLRHYISKWGSFFPFTSTSRLESLYIGGNMQDDIPNLHKFPCLSNLTLILERSFSPLTLDPLPDLPTVTSLTLLAAFESVLASVLNIITASNLRTLNLDLAQHMHSSSAVACDRDDRWRFNSGLLETHFPIVSVLKYRGHCTIYLRDLVTALAGGRRLKLDLDLPIRREVRKGDFDKLDEAMRWLEENHNLEWKLFERDPKAYFLSWEDARLAPKEEAKDDPDSD